MSSAHCHLLEKKKKTKSIFISGIKLSIFCLEKKKQQQSLKGKGKKPQRIAWKRPADDLFDHSYKLVSAELRTMHLFWIKYESYEIKIDEYREAFSTPELTMGVDHLYF